MSKLEIRAEIIKLGRLFDLPEERLEFLRALPASSIRAYRERAEVKLFSDDITLFRRLSLASKLIPASLVGLIGQHVFGPVLSARVAGEMEYPRAVKLAMKLPVDYLADICLHLDPKQTEDIIRNVPAERIREVCALLLERGEYITMGRFVGYLTDEAILVAIEAFENESDLLMVGFFAEDKPRLDSIIRMLDDDRLQRTIVAAQSVTGNASEGLWPEAVALMVYVQDDLKRKLGDMAASQDISVLASLLDTAHTQQLWSDVLPVVACMSPDSQRKVSELDALADISVMAPILQTAHEQHLWHALLPLVETMPQAQLETAANVLTQALPQEALEVVLQTAARQGIWAGILPLFDAMGHEQAQRIGEAIAVLPQSALEDAVHSADENDLWQSLLPLAKFMPEQQRAHIAEIVVELPAASLLRLVDAALDSDNDLQAILLNMLPLIPDEQRGKFETILKPLFENPPRRNKKSKPAEPAVAKPAPRSGAEPGLSTPPPQVARRNPTQESNASHPARKAPPRPFGLKLPGVLDSVYHRVEGTFPVTTALSFFGLDEMQQEYENLRNENQKLRYELDRGQGRSETEIQQKDQALAALRREKRELEAKLAALSSSLPAGTAETTGDSAASDKPNRNEVEPGNNAPRTDNPGAPKTPPPDNSSKSTKELFKTSPRPSSPGVKTARDSTQRSTGTRTPHKPGRPGNWRQGALTRSGEQRSQPVPPLRALATLPAARPVARPGNAEHEITSQRASGMTPAAKIFLVMCLIVATIVGGFGLLVLWLMSQQ